MMAAVYALSKLCGAACSYVAHVIEPSLSNNLHTLSVGMELTLILAVFTGVVVVLLVSTISGMRS